MCDEERTAADDAIEEVRECGADSGNIFDNDPGKYVAHLQEMHDQLVREGVIKAPPPRSAGEKTAA